MSDRPVTESPNPASRRLDELSTLEMVRVMNGEDSKVAAAVAIELAAIARAIDLIAEKLEAGGRLVYLGAGTSGRLGVLDAAECPPTFGTPPGQVLGLIAGGERALVQAVEGAEDRRDLAVKELARIEFAAQDVLVGISASGRTPFVLAGIEEARRRGARTIGLSCNPDSPLSQAAEIAITPVPGPEVVTGSTRLKAGTATKLVLNMLSTGVMVRLGHVRGNLMVDLRPGSAKLVGRAAGIVATLAGVDESRASALLEEHGGDVRAAVTAAAPATGRAGASALVLGIDGGGTKTVARLGGDAESEGRGGPCNLSSDLDGALQSIEEAVAAAFARAGVPRGPVDTLLLAAAGSADARVRSRASERLQRLFSARQVLILPDAALLLAAATPDISGVALVAGTGSLAYARTADGRCARAGGHGPGIGDPGSGVELGRAALRITAATLDGRRGSDRLASAVLRHLDVADGRALSAYGRAATPAKLAELAPLVLAAAADGDAAARQLVEQAALDLAELVLAVARKLALPITAAPLPLALGGGLLVHAAELREGLGRELERRGVRAKPIVIAEPVAGALALARRLAGATTDELSNVFTEAKWFPP